MSGTTREMTDDEVFGAAPAGRAAPREISDADVFGAPERSAGELVLRGVGNFGAGANEGIASIIGGPFDLVNRGLRGIGVPIPEGSVAGAVQRGINSIVGEPPKPENGAERFARGAGRGVVDAAAVLAPAAAVSRVAQAGSTTANVGRALASQPALQTAAGAVGSGTAEATDSEVAGLGATVGTALVPSAVVGATRAAGSLLGRAGLAVGLGDSEATAVRAITKALADDGLTPQQVAQRLADWQAAGAKPEALFDLGGENTRRLARTAAGRSGPGTERAVEFLAERQGAQAARVAEDVAANLGQDASDYHTALKRLNATRQKEAAPLYEAAFNETLAPEQFGQVARFMADPIGQEAMQRGLRVIDLEHLAAGSKFDPAAYGVVRGEGGKWVAAEGETPNMRLLDAVKRGFDEIVEDFRDKTTGRLVLNQYGKAVNGARAAYRDSLAEISPTYRAALESWAGPSQSMDALARGRELFKLRDGSAADAVLSNIRNPSDAEYFRLGVAQAIGDKVAGARDGADAVKRIFGSMKERALLRSVFPDSASFAAFENAMRREAAMFKNGQFVSPRTGSQTALREMDAGDFGAAATQVAGAALGVSGQSPGAALRQISINTLARARGLTPEVAEKVAKRLYTSDPAAIGAALDEAAAQAAKDGARGQVGRLPRGSALGMAAGTAMGALPEPGAPVPAPAAAEPAARPDQRPLTPDAARFGRRGAAAGFYPDAADPEPPIQRTDTGLTPRLDRAMEWLQGEIAARDNPTTASAIGSGLARGIVAGPESLAETARVATGNRAARPGEAGTSPEAALNAKPYSQVAWSGMAPWLGGKIAEGLASSAPTVAAALAGAAAGSPAGPLGALAGGAAGGALGSMAQTLGPAYQRALAAGKSPDEAVDDALKETGIAALFGGAGGAVGAGLRGTIRKALLDVFGVQPGLAVGQTAAANAAIGRPTTRDEMIEAGAVGMGTGLAFEAPGMVRGRAPSDAPFNETPPAGGGGVRVDMPGAGPDAAPAPAGGAPLPQTMSGGAAALPAPEPRAALTGPPARLALRDESGTVAGEGFTTRPTTPAERGASEAQDMLLAAQRDVAERSGRLLPAPDPVPALPAPEERLRIGVDPGVAAGEGFTTRPSDRSPNPVRYEDALNLARTVPGQEGPARRLALVVAEVMGEPVSWVRVPAAQQVEVMRRLAERVPAPARKPAETYGNPAEIPRPEPEIARDRAAPPEVIALPGEVARESVPNPQPTVENGPVRGAEEIAPVASSLPVGNADLGRPAGEPFQTYTPRGTEVPVSPRVVELTDLIASHDDQSFQPNPAYPHDEGIQPRPRNDPRQVANFEEMVGAMRPEQLGRTVDATSGAPIVDSRGVVVSGNGRTMMLRRWYRDGDRGQAYRAWLDKQGYNIAGMREPVLVAQTDMTGPALRKIAEESNAQTGNALGATAQADIDARAIRDALPLLKSADPTLAENADFVRAFMQAIPTQERPNLITPGLGLSPAGVRRIQTAVSTAAYGAELGPLMGRMAEGLDDGIKSIAGALQDAAPAWAQMRDMARQGEIGAEADITRDLAEAVRIVEDARQRKIPIVEILAQSDLDRPPLSRAGRAMLGAMFADPTLRRSASRKSLGDKLMAYARAAKDIAAGPDLFGTPPIPVDAVLTKAMRGEVSEQEAAKTLAERPAEVLEAVNAIEAGVARIDEAIHDDAERNPPGTGAGGGRLGALPRQSGAGQDGQGPQGDNRGGPGASQEAAGASGAGNTSGAKPDLLTADQPTYERALYDAAMARIAAGKEVTSGTSLRITRIGPKNRDAMRYHNGQVQIIQGTKAGQPVWISLGPVGQSIDTLAHGLGLPTSYDRIKAKMDARTPADDAADKARMIEAARILRPYFEAEDRAREAWVESGFTVEAEAAQTAARQALRDAAKAIGIKTPLAIDEVARHLDEIPDEPAPDLLGAPSRTSSTPRTPEPTIRNDARQAEIPGAEASSRQAIAARQADERGIRGAGPQKSVDDFGLFDSGINQRPLFSGGGTIPPLARGGSPRRPVTIADLVRSDATPATKAADARRIVHLLDMTSRYADGGIASPARAHLSDGGVFDRPERRPTVQNAPPPRPTFREAADDVMNTRKRNLGREVVLDWALGQPAVPGPHASGGIADVARRR